ncbi:MAG: hypothetical protein D6713_02310, partial [Deltaproteobacteria bacterium]
MRIRKFVSPTFQEAMEQVKKELGPDAIVLSTRTLGRDVLGMKKGAVEVTVAVEEENGEDLRTPLSQGNDLVPEMREIMSELRSLRSEVGFLRETLKPIIPVLSVSERKKELFTELVRRGVDVTVALSIVKKCGERELSLRDAILQTVSVEPPFSGKERGL